MVYNFSHPNFTTSLEKKEISTPPICYRVELALWVHLMKNIILLENSEHVKHERPVQVSRYGIT